MLPRRSSIRVCFRIDWQPPAFLGRRVLALSMRHDRTPKCGPDEAPSSGQSRSGLEILRASRYIRSMCNLYTYKLSRDEIRGLMEHYKLIGEEWAATGRRRISVA